MSLFGKSKLERETEARNRAYEKQQKERLRKAELRKARARVEAALKAERENPNSGTFDSEAYLADRKKAGKLTDLEFAKDYPDSTVDAVAGGERGAIRAEEVISPYYGKNFARELKKADQANEKLGVHAGNVPRRMFHRIGVSSGHDYASYKGGNVRLLGQTALEDGYVRLTELRDNPEDLKETLKLIREKNSYDTSNTKEALRAIYAPDPRSVLEHEVGHHLYLSPQTPKKGSVSADLRRYAKAAGVDSHIAKEAETTQAMGRLQREVYKQRGSRLSPEEFEGMVDTPPAYLTPEAKRILIYGQKLKEKSEDEGENKARAEMLRTISRGLPAVVENTKRPRRFFS